MKLIKKIECTSEHREESGLLNAELRTAALRRLACQLRYVTAACIHAVDFKFVGQFIMRVHLAGQVARRLQVAWFSLSDGCH